MDRQGRRSSDRQSRKYERMQAEIDAERRRDYVRGQVQAYTTFERTLVTLASGAIAVSLLIADRLRSLGEVHGAAALVTAWCCLTACLVLVVMLMLFSGLAYDRAIGQVDAGKSDCDSGGLWSCAVHCLDWVALVALAGGVVLLLVFVYLNLFTGGAS